MTLNYNITKTDNIANINNNYTTTYTQYSNYNPSLPKHKQYDMTTLNFITSLTIY